MNYEGANEEWINTVARVMTNQEKIGNPFYKKNSEDLVTAYSNWWREMGNHQWFWASILSNGIINHEKKYKGRKVREIVRKTMGLMLCVFKMAVEYLGEI